MRTCAECGAAIPPQKGSARPRKFCVVCRPPRNRKNPRVASLPASPSQPSDDPAEPLLLKAYREQLEAVGREASPEGVHVLHLARLFAEGQHTASGAASLSKELRGALEVAMKGAPKVADVVDELEERRRQKAAGA